MQETTRLVTRICHHFAVLALLAWLAMPTLALAQDHAVAAGVDEVAASAPSAAAESWGDSSVPENFVRSKGPAKEGRAYNWIQMGYAGFVMAIMIGFMAWLIRRTPAQTPARSK